MRYRIGHFLIVMAFVAVWLPLSKWLIELEAKDHPSIPQTAADYVGFYLGSTVPAGIPFALLGLWIEKRRRAVHAAGRKESHPGEHSQRR